MVQKRGGPLVVFVGSHSGQFIAAELHSGAVLWRTQLSDRVESSACVSLCGQYVVVGEFVIESTCSVVSTCLVTYSVS